jgi:tetratricopeptide (TPR) repeat protein
MENEKKLLFSPLFLKYQTDFEKNPKSRVFAPLAELYRKIGMTEKAMEILSQGIRYHPAYVMGYLGLAFCYSDLKQFNLAYTTLRPFLEENRDNIRMQKLYADVCMSLLKKDEALETLKYLLFINPRDKEIAIAVTVLEKELEGTVVAKMRPVEIDEERIDNISNFNIENSFKVDKLVSNPKEDFDDWMALDLGTSTNHQSNTEILRFEQRSEEKLESENKEIIELQKNAEPVLIDKPDYSPVVTHTLVDLYCGQGHLEKALEILEKILILNPDNQKTIDKKNEILMLISPYETVAHPNNEKTEEDGRKQLMDLIDEHVHLEIAPEPKKSDSKQLEKKYQTFLRKIQKRALDYQARI